MCCELAFCKIINSYWLVPPVVSCVLPLGPRASLPFILTVFVVRMHPSAPVLAFDSTELLDGQVPAMPPFEFLSIGKRSRITVRQGVGVGLKMAVYCIYIYDWWAPCTLALMPHGVRGLLSWHQLPWLLTCLSLEVITLDSFEQGCVQMPK